MCDWVRVVIPYQSCLLSKGELFERIRHVIQRGFKYSVDHRHCNINTLGMQFFPQKLVHRIKSGVQRQNSEATLNLKSELVLINVVRCTPSTQQSIKAMPRIQQQIQISKRWGKRKMPWTIQRSEMLELSSAYAYAYAPDFCTHWNDFIIP